MQLSEYKAEARSRLSGKWGKAALISLVFVVVELLIQSLFEKLFRESLAALIELLVLTPLSFGLIISFYKLFEGEDVSCIDFVKHGFQNYKRSFTIPLTIFLKLLLPWIITVIAAIVASTALITGNTGLFYIALIIAIGCGIYTSLKGLYYSLAYFVAADKPDITGSEAVDISRSCMEGKRLEYFCLGLSFIGWAILAGITLGIGMLWLIPYMQLSTVAFYKTVAE